MGIQFITANLLNFTIYSSCMGNSIFNYVQQLELLAFFSGYPLIYYLARLVSGHVFIKSRWGTGFVSILPFAYALVGTLYLGLQLRNLYPDYNVENIRYRIQQPYLCIWGLLSILFWIPAFSRRRIFSLLHSLVFFLMIIRDLFFQIIGVAQNSDIIKNDMNVYTTSIFLNLAAFLFLVLLTYLHRFRKKYPHS